MNLSVKKQPSKELILAHCVEIIAENGVRGLSLREVARRANVSHQAPYHYFKNDAEILSAIAREGFQGLTQAMKDASDRHPDHPLEALTASGVAYVEFAIHHVGHFKVMFQRALLPDHVLLSDLPEADATHALLRTLAQRTLDTGVAKTLGLEGLTLLCWSTVHGIASLLCEGLATGGEPDNHRAVIERVVGGLGRLLELSRANDALSE